VPEIYRLTFNGSTILLSSLGSPINVVLNSFVMNVNDIADPTRSALSGGMSSSCFGGGVTLATDPSLTVADGEICPNGGTIFVTEPGGSSAIFFQADKSVQIDADGNSSVDLTIPSCLDSRLFTCGGA
jgi:hypothetical protein